MLIILLRITCILLFNAQIFHKINDGQKRGVIRIRNDRCSPDDRVLKQSKNSADARSRIH